MKVKLLVSRAGKSISQKVGDVVDVSDDEGKRMIDRKQAVAVKAVKKKPAK